DSPVNDLDLPLPVRFLEFTAEPDIRLRDSAAYQADADEQRPQRAEDRHYQEKSDERFLRLTRRRVHPRCEHDLNGRDRQAEIEDPDRGGDDALDERKPFTPEAVYVRNTAKDVPQPMPDGPYDKDQQQ